MSKTNKKYYEIESCENNCERINELEQQKAGLLEYLNEIKEKCFEDNYYCGYIGNEIKEFLEKYI